MAAQPEIPDHQLRYTITLDGRDSVWPQLSAAEARDMLELGFRFSIFDDFNGEYRLSIPYSVMRLVDRDQMTFIQD